MVLKPPDLSVDVLLDFVEAPKFYLRGNNYELRITNYELYSLPQPEIAIFHSAREVTLPQFYPKRAYWGKHLCLTFFTPILPQLLL